MAKAKVKVNSPLRIGNKVFIRTVTYHYTGLVVAVDSIEVLLESAAWIADDGRFSQALMSGSFSEVEPYPDGNIVSVSRGAILDVSSWPHDLPRSVK